MTNAKFETIWKIMKDNSFKENNEISNDLICSICNKLMINACNGPCGCRFCSECIIKYLDRQERFCPGNLKYCKDELINFDRNIFIDQAINVRISSLVVNCPYSSCDFQDELRKIDNHMRICNKKTVNCPYLDIGCTDNKINLIQINDHFLKENYSHTKLLLDYINNLRNEMESLKEENKFFKEENKFFKEEIKNMKREAEQQNNCLFQLKASLQVNTVTIEALNQDEIKENIKNIEIKLSKFKSKFKKLEKISNNQKYGEYEWVVENFTEKLNQARNGINRMLYSNAFYSHKKGYKICLRVDPDGYEDGKGTHLSIYFSIMQGTYDYLVTWPCKIDVALALMNQQNGQSHSSALLTFKNNSDSIAYNKPTGERNICLGVHQFIDINQLINNNALIQDDQITVKCTVQILQ